jgi:hypothetical protein
MNDVTEQNRSPNAKLLRNAVLDDQDKMNFEVKPMDLDVIRTP